MLEQIKLKIKKKNTNFIYRPFHTDLGSYESMGKMTPYLDLTQHDYASDMWEKTADHKDYLGYEQNPFDLSFYDKLTYDQTVELMTLYDREMRQLLFIHDHFCQSNQKSFPSTIPAMESTGLDKEQIDRVLGMMNDFPLRILRALTQQSDEKKKLQELPGIGTKKAQLVIEWLVGLHYNFIPLTECGCGPVGFKLNVSDENILAKHRNAPRMEGKELYTLGDTSQIEGDDVIADNDGAIAENLDKEQKEETGIGKTMFWLIAIGIVLWWKWDEIGKYF